MNQTAKVTTDLWWAVPGVLAGMRGPFIDPRRQAPGVAAPLNAFQDELPALWQSGIRAVVCMLDAPQAVGIYNAAGFDCHFMPVPDGDAPTMEQFRKFLGFVIRHRAMNQPVAVHCEAGVGRTGVAIAGYFIMTEGLSPEEATNKVRTLRPGAVETARQMKFLHEVQVMRA